jgi:hypothetical protein
MILNLNSRVLFLVAAVVIVVLMYLNNRSVNLRERYESTDVSSSVSSEPAKPTQAAAAAAAAAAKPVPRENSAPMKGADVSDAPILNPNVNVNEMTTYPGPFEGCFPKQKELSPEDLLPKDMNSKWAQVNPAGQGMLMDRNFLDAGHHVGINTVGQSLRNANYNLRSEIPNPQYKVSPWMQSTIDPDVGRKPLEIGSGW